MEYLLKLKTGKHEKVCVCASSLTSLMTDQTENQVAAVLWH